MVQHEQPTPHELSQPVDQAAGPRKYRLEGRVSAETVGEYTIHVTQECPEHIRQKLLTLRTPEEVAAFLKNLHMLWTPSRRKVFHSPDLKNEQEPEVMAILKRKELKPNDPQFPGMDIEKFTTDVLHEMRTAYAMQDIFQRRAADLPKTAEIDGVTYALTYRVQTPWGAIENTATGTKYGIFEYLQGTSIRAEVASQMGWNHLTEKARLFFGKLNAGLDQIANICVDEGLEPWDFGLHQLIYTRNDQEHKIEMGIVDTEEFNFAEDGVYWPDSFRKFGMPPVIIFASVVDSDFD